MLAVTLDLDDTLWPIVPAIEAAEEALLAWFGANTPRVLDTVDTAALRRLRADEERHAPELSHDLTELRLRSIRRALIQAGYAADQADQAFQAFMQARNTVDLFPEVPAVLSELSADYRLGVISNGNADLEAIGLSHLFDFHLTARSAGSAKPNRRIFDQAIRLCGVLPKQIVHVGDDMERDVIGAKAVGMRAVWLDRSGQGIEESLADAVISNLTELRPLLTSSDWIRT